MNNQHWEWSVPNNVDFQTMTGKDYQEPLHSAVNKILLGKNKPVKDEKIKNFQMFGPENVWKLPFMKLTWQGTKLNETSSKKIH